MLRFLRNYWKYIKFLVTGDDSDQLALMGIKLEANPYCPEDKAFLLSLNGMSKEYDGVKIVAISLWSEGTKCEHTYKKVLTSKEHGIAIGTSNGLHKDYICSKCGHSFCTTVADEARDLADIWTAMAPKAIEAQK